MGVSGILRYIGDHGVVYTVSRGIRKVRESRFGTFERIWQKIGPDEAELARQRAQQPDAGCISICVPVYNTDPAMLRAMIDSVLAQTYTDWQLCLYDGCSPKQETREVLRAYAAKDPRITLCEGTDNDGISGNTNRAIAMAHGEWIALLDHDDLLTPDAMYRAAEVICRDAPDMIYSDEDKVTEDGRVHTDPHFKPDFCPDNLRSGNYFCHLMLIRRSLIEQVGGLRPAFDGSQDHDLALRCIEHTDKVAHIPHILYHWRSVGSSMSHGNLERCRENSRRAVEEHINRLGMKGTVSGVGTLIRINYETDPDAEIELIVLEHGDPATWTQLRRMAVTMEKRDHIRICSVSPWRESADRLSDKGAARWVEWRSGESMYTAMNRAAASSKAQYLVFLYGGVTMEGTDWLRELLMYAQRDDVGAVTAKLTGQLFQGVVHGGYAIGMRDIAASLGAGMAGQNGGWHDIMQLSHNITAAAPACLMINRDKFVPFDETYRGGLGAVDWCLTLQRNGLRHVYTPWAKGALRDRAVQDWLLLRKKPDPADAEHFTQKWGSDVNDPCYSRYFNRRRADYEYEDKVK